MGAKVKGIREAKANLDRLIDDIQGRKAVRAVTSALFIASAQAASYTPVDTSYLINSQFREIMVNGTLITGRIGYSANYALQVHDPNHAQHFRLARAKKEFLVKGVKESESTMEKAIRQEMKL
ncbi:HK97 gp10 family phage protein [Yersinia intermedia]|uniref:HK97 gp10 family phage protein n=1 Tax=Yersinia intermedia TaxID=631 RepID=UPI0022FF080B|nr:HK97 gp10 family phage protein [Yersinia intermedia]MDA5481853.1 HK97 gp10 family phage protein [Yersinia intermedia]